MEFTSEHADRLNTVTDALILKHRELASLVSAEKEGKVMGHFRADEKSVAARDREADFQVLNITTDIIRLKGDIASLETEHRTLLAILDYAGRSARASV